jgi:subtilisin family serine protease
VVVDQDEISEEEKGTVVSQLAASHGFQPNFTYQHSIVGFAAVLSDGQVEALRADRRIKSVSPDVKISLYPEPNHHRDDHDGGPPEGGDDDDDTSNQVTPWGIDRIGGPLVQSSNRAWVIDTGIDLDHRDLNVNTTLGKNCVKRGKDSFDDGNGHGTHVSGTIAAIDNTVDVVGATENTELVPVRVLDNSGSGFLSWISCGVDHEAANFGSGDVANMSLGGKTDNTDLDDAVIAAADDGLLFSIAAGNNGEDASLYTPARTGDDHSNIYTVAAIDQDDNFTSWSNFGDPVSFAGPGVNVLSTKKGGGTEEKTGTSMSAPHVSGLLLLNQLCDDGTVTGTDGQEYFIPFRCNDDDLLAS